MFQFFYASTSLNLDLLETRAHFKVDRSCHVIAAGGEERGAGGQPKGAAAIVSTILFNDQCLLRRTCGHCATLEPGGVMDVSGGELRSTKVRKINLS